MQLAVYGTGENFEKVVMGFWNRDFPIFGLCEKIDNVMDRLQSTVKVGPRLSSDPIARRAEGSKAHGG